MVKRVLTSIITLAVLMGVLVACGDSNSSLIEVDTEEAKDETEKVLEDQKGQESRQEQPTQPSPPTTSEPSPPLVLHPPAQVRVLVANGTDVGGAAEVILEVLISAGGYNGLPPVVARTEEVPNSSFVYYANGYELDAINIGLIINVDSANVLPMPAVLPVADLAEANVLVLLGSDLYPAEE